MSTSGGPPVSSNIPLDTSGGFSSQTTDEGMYPKLNNNPFPQPSAPIEDEKKDELEVSVSYDMMEGITTMGEVDCVIEFEIEGKIDQPLHYKGLLTHVGLSDKDFNDKLIEELAKKLHEAISPKLSKRLTFRTPDVKQTFIDVFGPLNNVQRVQLKTYYDKQYKANIIKFIRKKFSGALADLFLSLLMTLDEFRACWVERSLVKKDINLLSTILLPLEPAEIARVQKVYNEKNKKKPLLNTINDKTKSWFKNKTIYYIYENLLTNKKPEDNVMIDETLMFNDVEQLINASNGKNVDKKTFVEIFTTRSNQHLASVAQTYLANNQKGTELIKTIEESFKESSETGHALKIILLYATQRPKLFSVLLNKAMVAPGPNYEFLSRIVIDRCEVDFGNILMAHGKLAFDGWCENRQKTQPHYFKMLKYLTQ